MTTEYKLKKIQEVLDKLGDFKATGIYEYEHKPHMFEISLKHIKAGSKNNNEITEEILLKYPCGKKGCKLSYDRHNKKQRLIMQLKRDVKKENVIRNLKNIEFLIKKFNINEFAWADSVEKYKFI